MGTAHCAASCAASPLKSIHLHPNHCPTLPLRAQCAGNTSLAAVNTGDVTQINDKLNDLDSAYVFLPLSAAQQQRPWRGGVNLTALAMLEERERRVLPKDMLRHLFTLKRDRYYSRGFKDNGVDESL